jgi:hypothetical protein
VLQLGTPEAHLELGVHLATRLGLFFFHHGARVAAVVQIETLAVRILPATLPRLALFVEAQARHLGGQVEIIFALRALSVLVEVETVLDVVAVPAVRLVGHRGRLRADGFGLGADDGFRRTHLARHGGRFGRERLLDRPDILARHIARINLTRRHGSAPNFLAVPLHAARCGATSLDCRDNNGWNVPSRGSVFKIAKRPR